jgi:S-DNA-T family DNA segregation ATPase FtsK/SpoIIIE
LAEQAVRRTTPTLGREVASLSTIVLAILVLLSLASFDDRDIHPGTGDTQNLIGPVGAYLAHGLYSAFGYASYLVAAALVLAAAFAFFRWPSFGWHRTVGGILCLPTLALLLHLSLAKSVEDVAGGALGEALGEALRGVVHTTGAWIIGLGAALLCVLLATPVTLSRIGRSLRRAGAAIHQWAELHAARFRRRRALARERRAERERKHAEKARLRDEKERARAKEREPKLAPVVSLAPSTATPNAETQAAADDALDTAALVKPSKRRASAKAKGAPTISAAAAARVTAEPTQELGDADVLDAVDIELPTTERSTLAKNAETPATPATPLALPDANEASPDVAGITADDSTSSTSAVPPPLPKIVEPTVREKPHEMALPRQQTLFAATEQIDWRVPDLDLLEYDDSSHVTFDRDELMKAAERLTRALGDFRIEGRVVEIHPGPVVTMYEFELAAGTKVKQVQSLEDDLALALQAVKVRITAIPGKGVLGIEVANREREIVYLKEIVGSEKFHKMQSKLPLALGKDISGQPVVTDLAKMPHLLVAGTTGSGKSVGLNSMLLSFLYSATPDDVRIILVDQKTTEFGPYDHLPHLLLPVVVDPKRAAVALRWAVEEMERRYGLMSELGVRHIVGYNKRIEQMKASGETFPADEPLEGEEPLPPRPVERMPYIVVMIDELADLMMVAPREVEGSLQRLAQMARAAGIHIVIATQRPSVDVVSGVIRANFPARIAFQTRTRTDSRTILDDGGAEQLLGQGDMLLLPPGTSTLQRVHGAFVSDAEVKRVCDHWRAQGKPNYDPTILQVKSDDPEAADDDEPADEMYDQAIAIVAETRQVSISMIQRRLRVGYNRAARMVERMERDGIIGPNLGPNQPREIYANPMG